MTPRRPLTQRQKEALLNAQDGRCAVKTCRAELKSGRFEDDHHQARIFGGGEELENRRLICLRCHRQKTAGENKANRKGKRIKYGKTKRPSRPMWGTHASGWKKPMSGGGHWRKTGWFEHTRHRQFVGDRLVSESFSAYCSEECFDAHTEQTCACFIESDMFEMTGDEDGGAIW